MVYYIGIGDGGAVETGTGFSHIIKKSCGVQSSALVRPEKIVLTENMDTGRKSFCRQQ